MSETKLRKLMQDLINARDIPDIDITGLAYDSREVKPGYLFAALRGAEQDGHDYIQQAIDNGAALIIGSKPLSNLSVPYIRVESPRNSLAMIAARYYEDPTRDMPVIGITGTNGKTTCAYLIESILSAAGYSPVVLGTIHYRY
ncbi:MAG: Mur ligase domain-containing protein, partial [Planctomycetota bacterium]